jgi:hypothetical protein
MSNQPMQPFSSNPMFARHGMLCVLAVASCAMSGCQDGPLYALKVANPYYSMGEWKRDREIGITDHERREQLTVLADTMDQLPEEKQQFWVGHLDKILENDESPEMRRLAVQAAGGMNDSSGLEMIERGLDDESMKVRMEACNALGNREGDEAARMLAATVGTETNQDVKHAALTALAKHKTPIAVDSLKIALADRNPATRDLAVQSLKGSTGKNYGDDPQVWIAALDGNPPEEVPATRLADRVRDLF